MLAINTTDLLVIADEKYTAPAQNVLVPFGYTIRLAASEETLYAALEIRRPRLILLDLGHASSLAMLQLLDNSELLSIPVLLFPAKVLLEPITSTGTISITIAHLLDRIAQFIPQSRER